MSTYRDLDLAEVRKSKNSRWHISRLQAALSKTSEVDGALDAIQARSHRSHRPPHAGGRLHTRRLSRADLTSRHRPCSNPGHRKRKQRCRLRRLSGRPLRYCRRAWLVLLPPRAMLAPSRCSASLLPRPRRRNARHCRGREVVSARRRGKATRKLSTISGSSTPRGRSPERPIISARICGSI